MMVSLASGQARCWLGVVPSAMRARFQNAMESRPLDQPLPVQADGNGAPVPADDMCRCRCGDLPTSKGEE